jgi:hypothetical protein
MSEVVERALDACVTPAWILARHSGDQVGDDFHDPKPTRRTSPVGPLPSDEFPVPTKDRVRRDERGNFGRGASPDRLAANREPTALIIGQPKSSRSKLLFEDSVLLSEVFDDRILLAADPASQGGSEDLPGLEDCGHRPIVPTLRRNRQLFTDGQTE